MIGIFKTRVPYVTSLLVFNFLVVSSAALKAQTAWFVDGYHGGIHGHYPAGYTGFLVEQLKKNPQWRIILEIEPETWDMARVYEPGAYAELKRLIEDESGTGRIEIVNPTYAQSYLFQSSGESVIRQFDYGIRKVREHFPNVRLTTYSSEEPCFTSCLPPVLKSFGYQFASLKNPNTCWGGYTSAHGGELVNWIGPDGTSIFATTAGSFPTMDDLGTLGPTRCSGGQPWLTRSAISLFRRPLARSWTVSEHAVAALFASLTRREAGLTPWFPCRSAKQSKP